MITPFQYQEMQRRLAPKRDAAPIGEPVERESKLHDQIIQHCRAQWPPLKFIHARMDKKSTIDVAAQDFTIFLPGGRVLCIECKSKSGKRTKEQQIWAHEMSLLGHEVFEVRSFEDFLAIAQPLSAGQCGDRPELANRAGAPAESKLWGGK